MISNSPGHSLYVWPEDNECSPLLTHFLDVNCYQHYHRMHCSDVRWFSLLSSMTTDSASLKLLRNTNILMYAHVHSTFNFIDIVELVVTSSRIRWWLISIIVSQHNPWMSFPGFWLVFFKGICVLAHFCFGIGKSLRSGIRKLSDWFSHPFFPPESFILM